MSSPDAAGSGGARIKSAASALLKGGTLVSEPCPKCGGVQVRLADKTSCINCGYENAAKGEQKTTTAPQVQAAGLGASAAIVEGKIAGLASELKDEKDTAVQRQKAELLEAYLRILEKMKALSAK
ncbi:Sjogren's syndrome/scleroderma autoantigen 1 family protein [Nitrososphaera viennensis]|nr:Sjogren's syndrome/scleroderma autoantigen 1 family protein [Nitrososphaera viennensis]UVS69332.1 autoantigen p27 domain-containing protein [Nitrososphaera viennensis]